MSQPNSALHHNSDSASGLVPIRVATALESLTSCDRQDICYEEVWISVEAKGSASASAKGPSLEQRMRRRTPAAAFAAFRPGGQRRCLRRDGRQQRLCRQPRARRREPDPKPPKHRWSAKESVRSGENRRGLGPDWSQNGRFRRQLRRSAFAEQSGASMR